MDISKVHTLGDILVGKVEGRTSDKDITLFTGGGGSAGLGTQFAAMILHRAPKKKVWARKFRPNGSVRIINLEQIPVYICFLLQRKDSPNYRPADKLLNRLAIVTDGDSGIARAVAIAMDGQSKKGGTYMSDFEAAEAIPIEVVRAMQKHPAFKNHFKGDNIVGSYLYYEKISEDNGDVWHLVVAETKEGIIQFGMEDKTMKMQFFHPISINELRFYCYLSEDFRTTILTLADEIEREEDIHDHYGPPGAGHGHRHGHGHG